MKQQLIKKLADQLKSSAEGALPPGKESEFLGFQMHDGVAYSLTNEAARTFNEVVSKLLGQKQFSKKFSSKYIEKKLKTVFAELLSNPKCDLEKKISDLGDELSSFDQNNIVFLKKGALIYAGDVSKIGENREENEFEIQGDLTLEQLNKLFENAIITKVGKTLNVKVELDLSAEMFLKTVLDQDYKISYFRNISSSTRKLF